MQQLSPDEKNFIFQIANSIRYPIVRLELRSSKERSLISTALNHVHLETKQDSMEVVKQRASILQSLCEKGFIEILLFNLIMQYMMAAISFYRCIS